MEQHSLLLFSLISDFSAGAINFDTITEAPPDSLILTTVKGGLLTEIAADSDLVIFKLLIFSSTSISSVLVGATSGTSFLTF